MVLCCTARTERQQRSVRIEMRDPNKQTNKPNERTNKQIGLSKEKQGFATPGAPKKDLRLDVPQNFRIAATTFAQRPSSSARPLTSTTTSPTYEWAAAATTSQTGFSGKDINFGNSAPIFKENLYQTISCLLVETNGEHGNFWFGSRNKQGAR